LKPILSIIIAATNGMPEIGWCLTALEKQKDVETIEVIVVEPGEGEAAQALQKQFPWIRLISIERRLPIPEMRNLAFECSQGEIVAILEDHEVVSPGWCQGLLSAHQAFPQVAAVAGPIENGCTASLTDWAAFFCEYSTFMPPVSPGLTHIIPGNNVAYKRWALESSLVEDRKSAFWETSLHPVLVQRGCQFRMEPDIVVSHQKHFGSIEYLQQRYHYSRYYASFITRQRSWLYKLVRSAACVILPVLLMYRILFCGFSKRRFMKELLLSLPLLVVFSTVWAVGEMTGYLFGTGHSLSLIE
jgi:glycosyltransferase involved in cell wall biosynthesis